MGCQEKMSMLTKNPADGASEDFPCWRYGL